MGDLVIKNGVNLTGLSERVAGKLWRIEALFAGMGYACVVTSARRPPGVNKSYHATGEAVDLRAKHMLANHRQAMLGKLKAALGADYDVILHGEGDNIHFHVEYDPK